MNVLRNYHKVKNTVTECAIHHGRKPEDIKIVVVTKNHLWDEIVPLFLDGCLDFGENKQQEALPKITQAPKEINWHFIGPLQTNKVKKIVPVFSMIHSVDSPELARKISEAAQETGNCMPILLQSNTSGELSKQGLTPEQWKREIEKILILPGVRPLGLMTMAPLTEDEQVIRECFSKLRDLRDELSASYNLSQFSELSMGMSHDYCLAIEEGATLLRIGSAIFENRSN